MRWNSIAPFEASLETVVHRLMLFKIGVLNIFKNFSRKHPRWSLLLMNFIKNRLQRRYFWQNLQNFYRILFRILSYRTPQVSAFVFRKDFIDISYENSHTHSRRLNVAAAYLFLKCMFILVSGFFPNWWDTYINYIRMFQNLLRFLYRLNQALWEIHGIA